jgi:hypothetical protein
MDEPLDRDQENTKAQPFDFARNRRSTTQG